MPILRGKYYVLPSEEDDHVEEQDTTDQIERLRLVLRIMTQGAGTRALGSKRRYDMPASTRPRLVTTYEKPASAATATPVEPPRKIAAQA